VSTGEIAWMKQLRNPSRVGSTTKTTLSNVTEDAVMEEQSGRQNNTTSVHGAESAVSCRSVLKQASAIDNGSRQLSMPWPRGLKLEQNVHSVIDAEGMTATSV
jgi:hypothetical protein